MDSIAFMTLKVPLGCFTRQCFQHALPKLESKRINFRLGTAVRNCGLLLAQPENGEQTCVIQIRTVNLMTMIFYPASHLQMKRLGIPEFAVFNLTFHMTELPVVFGFD